MTVDQIKRMYKEVCLLGPMAAMFGREVQQILMSPDAPNLISMDDFQNSVNSGRASLSQQKIADAQVDTADDYGEDDQVSQTSKRTRSPRKALYRDIRTQQAEHRPANLRASPSYIRDEDLERQIGYPETRRR